MVNKCKNWQKLVVWTGFKPILTNFKSPLVIFDRWSLFIGRFNTKIPSVRFRVVIVDWWLNIDIKFKQYLKLMIFCVHEIHIYVWNNWWYKKTRTRRDWLKNSLISIIVNIFLVLLASYIFQSEGEEGKKKLFNILENSRNE